MTEQQSPTTARGTIRLIVFCLLLASCSRDQDEQKEAASTVYFNGDIISMEGEEPQYVEAVVAQDGKIVFVGSKKAADEQYRSATPIDLDGKTMLPGFIDPHSHFTSYGNLLGTANLNPPPIGSVTSIPAIIDELEKSKEANKITPASGIWLVGNGYDQDFLQEQRHPTAADLDQYFPDIPVVIMHTSGHMLVANTKALHAVGIDEKTKDPAGGQILRIPGTTKPEGLVLELARLPFLSKMVPQRPMSEHLDRMDKAQEYYASNGITTAQDGMTQEENIEVLNAAAKEKRLYIDVIALPAYQLAPKLVGNDSMQWGKYRNRLKYGGIKLTIDGSPQGKSALLTQPYLTAVPGCERDCKGITRITQDQVNELLELLYKNRVQLFTHCNGDGAIDMYIEGHKNAMGRLGLTRDSDLRTVVIHSQIMRRDQLEAYKAVGLIPSFFTNHVFYWGDIHVRNLGEERASYISPMKSAFDLGLPATNHSDYMVTPVDPLFMVWTAVNRTTRSGKVLGPDERISPYQAIKALTINAAYQYFEEDTKGSLKAGKLADLVILDRNPLKVDRARIKDIKVVETIKDGKTIYENP